MLRVSQLLNTIILVFIGIVIVLVLLYFYQTKLIYPAPKTQVKTLLPEYISKIDLELSHSFLLMPKLPTRKSIPLIIFTHGNAELADYWLNDFDTLDR